MNPSPSLRTALLPLTAMAIAAATPAAAQAEQTQGPDATQAAATAEAPALFAAAPLAEAVLARSSGRENQPTWQSANAQSNTTVKDNRVGDNSPTGALSVSDAAFQNVTGISMINLNTGNASAINATMSVNVSIQMAPVTGAPGGL